MSSQVAERLIKWPEPDTSPDLPQDFPTVSPPRYSTNTLISGAVQNSLKFRRLLARATILSVRLYHSHIVSVNMRHQRIQFLPVPTDDIRDPLRWPFWLQLSAILSTSIANFVSNMGGAGLSVSIPLLMQQFHKSQSDATQTLTVRVVIFFA